jgi:hypothetical protein
VSILPKSTKASDYDCSVTVEALGESGIAEIEQLGEPVAIRVGELVSMVCTSFGYIGPKCPKLMKYACGDL